MRFAVKALRVWPIQKLSLAAMVVLVTISACATGEPSDEQIENAKIKVAEIRDGLYVPHDSELLAEGLTYGTNPELYPGCVMSTVDMAYKSPRSFEQVLAEYREELLATGWTPAPGYEHDKVDVDFFVSGPQVSLTLSSFPLRPDLLSVPIPTTLPNETETIYYIALYYDDPSSQECGEA